MTTSEKNILAIDEMECCNSPEEYLAIVCDRVNNVSQVVIASNTKIINEETISDSTKLALQKNHELLRQVSCVLRKATSEIEKNKGGT